MILTRGRAVPLLANVTLAGITGTARGLPTELPLDERYGLAGECVINCDNLFTVPKARSGDVAVSSIPKRSRICVRP